MRRPVCPCRTRRRGVEAVGLVTALIDSRNATSILRREGLNIENFCDIILMTCFR